jgi:hypothetical protein
MARSKPRIDVIKRLGNAVVFSIDDRLAIEAKYGHKLTSRQWEQITDVTSILMELIPGLKDATPLSAVLSRFEKLEAAAKSVRSEFDGISIAGNFTPQEIYWAFFARRRRCPPPSEEWDFLNEILGAVIKFSEYAIRQIQRPDPEHPNWLAFSEGEVWNMWVNALTKIMKNNGLPHGVRKDSDKNIKESPSSFVTLIKELQNCLPVECRKFTHSDYALAQGIFRARHGK